MTVMENSAGRLLAPRQGGTGKAHGSGVFAFPVIAQRRRQLAGTLSGGEQQMLAIGRG
jgi:branched-chain amino acid transport system ATP-binding protein